MLKNINISNAKQLKKFYKKLPFYNSFINYFIFYKINNSNLLEINEALNIKNKRQKITFIYDSACLTVDNYFNNQNICGFKNNKCYVQRKKKSEYCNGCCHNCIYQNRNGCPTHNLTCKLFFCSEVKKRTKVIQMNDLIILKCLTIRQRTILKYAYFATREQVINDLMIGSIFVFSLKLIFRQIKNFIKLKYEEK